MLIFDPRELSLHTEADAKRLTDEEVGGAYEDCLTLRTLGFGPGSRPGSCGAAAGRVHAFDAFDGSAEGRVLRNEVNAFLKEEGVAIALTPGYNGDGGTIFASYGGSQDPEGSGAAADRRDRAGAVQPHRRLLQHGITPKLTFDIETEYQKEDLMGFNVIGEIPGTTKPDEVVMVGGHFDSWQGGTGATDNGTGSSVAMEAVRILAACTSPWRGRFAWRCGAAKKRGSTARPRMCNSTSLRATR